MVTARPTKPFAFRMMTLLISAALASLLACGPKGLPVSAPPLSKAPARAPKVALVLGGGGARGFAEIGVLRVFEQEKIPVDMVVGTSVGSLIGALYCDTGRVLDAEFLAVGIQQEDLFDYKALALLSGGFVKGERLERYLDTHLKHKTIEGLAVPFAAVAVDLKTGQPVAFERGSVAQAVHASCAIPGVFVPVEFGGSTYVDGGIVDPIPADFARQKGADVVIAVAIPKSLPKQVPNNTLELVHYSVTLMQAEIGRLRAKEADLVIYPDVGSLGFTDFSQKKQLMEAGEEAARRALPAIRAAISAKAEALRRNAEPHTGTVR
jgi:NTE family protein